MTSNANIETLKEMTPEELDACYGISSLPSAKDFWKALQNGKKLSPGKALAYPPLKLNRD